MKRLSLKKLFDGGAIVENAISDIFPGVNILREAGINDSK